jgi:DNA-binding NtrC family response regulator
MACRILSVSHDVSLLNTREKVLARAGYSVCSFADTHEAVQALAKDKYDVVILGQSLTPAMKHELAAKASGAGARLVEITIGDPVVCSPEDSLQAPVDPEDMLATVKNVTDQMNCQ